jgi:hypothetical protein
VGNQPQRIYKGIQNVDYSGMTDLVEVIEWKLDDNEIGDTQEV